VSIKLRRIFIIYKKSVYPYRMTVEKKEKKDESGFQQHAGGYGREGGYHPGSPRHSMAKNEYAMPYTNSPAEKDMKEIKEGGYPREGGYGNFVYGKDAGYGAAMGERMHGNVSAHNTPSHSMTNMPGANSGHSMPFNMPHPSYPRPYPYKEYYQRRYNDYQKDFIINKKKEDLNLNDAISFLETVKTVFADDPSIYDSFLEVMRDYKHGKIDAGGVVRAATTLFKGKPDILEGFNDFLPPEYKIDRGNRRRMRMEPPGRPIERMNERFMPGHERMMDRPDRMGERIVPDRAGERPIPHDRVLPKDMPKVMDAKQFVPGSNPPLSAWDGQQAEEQTVALNFIKKVKSKLNNMKLYKEFIEALTHYQKTKDELVLAKIKKILGDNRDLIDEFLTFMPKGEDSALAEVKKILEAKNVYEEFLKAMNLFNQKLMEGKELIFFLRAYIKDEKMIEAFKEHLGQHNAGLFESKGDKFVNTEDLGGILGSYRIYKDKGFRSNQDALSKQVLNHVCYSFPLYASEEEDVQFKRSAYMETLYRLEDERYEIELLIERGESLIFSFEVFLNSERSASAEKDGDGDEQLQDELDLSQLHMPAPLVNEMILFIYGDRGEEIFEELISKPRAAMPVILKRMYKLIRYWKLELREKEKLWKDTNERAFYKALDFHLDFKAIDKKYLNFRNFSKHLECDIDVSGMECMKELAMMLYKLKHDDDSIDDVLKIRNGGASAETAIRLRYFYLLMERLAEIKDKPFFMDVVDLLKGHLEAPVNDFEEKLRIVSKAQAYKLATIDKLLDKINKREHGHDEMYEVLLGDRLVIRSKNEQDEYAEKYSTNDIDNAFVRDRVFMNRNLRDQRFCFSYRITVKICRKSYKIKYSEDEIDYIFRKGFCRVVQTPK
ncbi:Histone deacetylase complex, SIN3 component, partial [Trachipleistophora hominis]